MAKTPDNTATRTNRQEHASAVNGSSSDGVSHTVGGSQTLTGVQWCEKAKDILCSGDVVGARQVVERGLDELPDDLELHKLARLLSPPRVVRSGEERRPTDTDWEFYGQWLREHGLKHRGMWIAIREGAVLGAEPSVARLRERAGDISGAFVTKVY